MQPLPSPNNYRERLIEKLQQQIAINGENCPAADELRLLLNPASGASTENAKGEAEKPAKPKKE